MQWRKTEDFSQDSDEKRGEGGEKGGIMVVWLGYEGVGGGKETKIAAASLLFLFFIFGGCKVYVQQGIRKRERERERTKVGGRGKNRSQKP